MSPLDNVQAELKKALAERAALDEKIQALKQTAKLLEPIYGKQPREFGLNEMVLSDAIGDLGLTAAVERILMFNAGEWLAPTSVRNALKDAGFELSGDNPMASIHQVLRRLVARNQSPYSSMDLDGTNHFRFDPLRSTMGRMMQTSEKPPDSLATKIAKTMLDAEKKKNK